MPAETRMSKRRTHHVSDEARARWLACGPGAIQLADGGAGLIADEALAAALDLPPLIYRSGKAVLLADLEGGAT